ncbi:MAG: glutaminase domain-containing protein [Planctomycetota bacterium]
MIPMEWVLGRLGSRFFLHFKPRENEIRLSPLGTFFDKPYHLNIAVEVGGETRSLPFIPQWKQFPEVDLETGLCSAAWTGTDRALGVRLTAKFIAPFWPQDSFISGAPVFFVDLAIKDLRTKGEKRGVSLLFELGAHYKADLSFPKKLESDHTVFTFDDSYRLDHARPIFPPKPPAQGANISSRAFKGQVRVVALNSHACFSSTTMKGRGFRWNFTMEPGDIIEDQVALAGLCLDPVLEVRGKPHKFHYTFWATDAADIVKRALESHDEIQEKTAAFENLAAASSLGHSARQLMAVGFQGWLVNTWDTIEMVAENEADPDADESFFSVWEGNCCFHSTVDVEYNQAPFYLLCWPELLQKQLGQWALFEKRHDHPGFTAALESGAARPPLDELLAADKSVQMGVISHDMGIFNAVNGMAYEHDMAVEENCNYLLMLAALVRMHDRREFARAQMPLVARLATYLVKADRTGKGLPTHGTANTIDDASPALQLARRQVYLGIKTHAALLAAGDLARMVNDDTLAEFCVEHARRAASAIESEGWEGDHFAVCLDTTLDGLTESFSGGKRLEGPMPGRNAYSIYTSNGLVYRHLVGQRTEIDLDRLREDLLAAHHRTLTEYGNRHTSDAGDSIRISQCLWRDFAAAYLGIDLLDGAERYWNACQREQAAGRGGPFCDTPLTNYLHLYPRGLAAFGLLFAVPGLSIDAVERRVRFRPVRVPCRIPLVYFADWSKNLIPWMNCVQTGGKVRVRMENSHLLTGWNVALTV